MAMLVKQIFDPLLAAPGAQKGTTHYSFTEHSSQTSSVATLTRAKGLK